MTTSWYLVGSSGPSSGSSFELVGPSITVGRVAGNDIVVDDNMVSRHHARLEMRGDTYILTDLGSANGTWVNGRRISEPVTLQANDSIRFGRQSGFIFSARPFLGGDETFVVEDMTPERAPMPAAAPARPRSAAKGGLPGWFLAIGCVLVILIVVLVAALIVFLVLPSRTKSKPSVGVKPTLPVITAIPLGPTSTLTPQLAPTSEVILPVQPEPPRDVLVYSDDFSDPDSGWGRTVDDNREKYYENGEYVILIKRAGRASWTWGTQDTFSDFTLETDARLVEGPDGAIFGVVFRLQDNDNFYYVYLNGEGSYKVGKRQGGEWQSVADVKWTLSPHIKTGGATNRLKVICLGTKLSLYVNGQYLTTVQDASFDAGKVGVIAEAVEGLDPIKVAFDNLKVYIAEVEAATPSAKVTGIAPSLYPPPLGKIVFAANRDNPSDTLAIHARSGEAVAEKDLYVMNADGSGLVRLTDEARDDSMPRWSPDGQRIVFVSSRDGNFNVFVMNADGSAVTRLTDDPASDLDPTWSPDGQRIAFCSDRDRNQEIYVMNADGFGQVNITNNPANDYVPDWSPDGERIAFTSDRDGNEDIYLMRPDGSQVTKLTQNPATDYHPDWSPDGKRIVFASDRGGNFEIYMMNADGSGQVRLTDDPAGDRVPCWSPDGNYILFHREVDGNWEVYIMRADGSEQRNLTNNPARDADADWSANIPLPPTSTPMGPPPTPTRKLVSAGLIAFVSSRDGNDEIYVMNPDGSNQRRLTNTPAQEWHPAWSPDGTRIVFQSMSGGASNVCMVNADGSGYAQITNWTQAEGSAQCPVWSPNGRRIAVTREVGGGQAIYVMNTDGSDQVEIVSVGRDPSWSPDGTRIAFIRWEGGGLQIWTVSPDGSNVKVLTQGDHDHVYPTWSPDGRQIAFEYDHTQVAVMDAGGGPPRIVADKGSHNLDWSPDGSKLVISPSGEGIWLVNTDGSGLTQIAQEGKQPSWQAVP